MTDQQELLGWTKKGSTASTEAQGGKMIAPWLTEFCSDDESRTALHTPFAYHDPVRGKVLCATNGHRILALFDAPADGVRDCDAMLFKGVSLALSPVSGGVVLPLADFRAFLAQHVPNRATCTACKGAGAFACDECEDGWVEHECTCGDLHDCECGKCEGMGNAPCGVCRSGRHDAIIVRVGTLLYDARYFARPTEALSGEYATFTQFIEPERQGIAIDGDGWRLVVMSRRNGNPVGEFALREPVAA